VTAPTESWTTLDRMLAVSEEFYRNLQLPYRVISIVSGALNNAAAKKYDLEAWFAFVCFRFVLDFCFSIVKICPGSRRWACTVNWCRARTAQIIRRARWKHDLASKRFIPVHHCVASYFHLSSICVYFFRLQEGSKEKAYVHMLNGTLCATQRTMCAVLENYQTPTGVKVPSVLV
jgi:seryl-tRNA synthetase